jgi:hypothetical protein
VNFKLRLVDIYKRLTFYDVIFEGDEMSEFSKFLSDPLVRADESYEDMLARIQEILDDTGYDNPNYFRYAETRKDNVRHIPFGNLRVFIVQCGEIIIMIGCGGVKKTNTYNEDVKLDTSAKRMKHVSDTIDKLFSEGKLRYHNKRNILIGDIINEE